jgi:hypothetical protein
MYCRLCEAEYREGFTTWSDGRVVVVGSVREGQSRSGKLWKSDKHRGLDRSLAALNAENIPSHFKEVVHPTTRASILGIPLGPQHSRFEYEARALGKRLARAEEAIKKIVGMPDFDD